MSDRDTARGMEHRNVVVLACHTALNLRQAACAIPSTPWCTITSRRWLGGTASSLPQRPRCPSPSVEGFTAARVSRRCPRSGGTALRLGAVDGSCRAISLWAELDSAMLLSTTRKTSAKVPPVVLPPQLPQAFGPSRHKPDPQAAASVDGLRSDMAPGSMCCPLSEPNNALWHRLLPVSIRL
jgi:hypothetical protein